MRISKIAFFQILSLEELKHHIVLTTETVKLDNSVSNFTLKTLTGDILILRYDTQANMVRLRPF